MTKGATHIHSLARELFCVGLWGLAARFALPIKFRRAWMDRWERCHGPHCRRQVEDKSKTLGCFRPCGLGAGPSSGTCTGVLLSAGHAEPADYCTKSPRGNNSPYVGESAGPPEGAKGNLHATQCGPNMSEPKVYVPMREVPHQPQARCLA